MTLSGNHQVYTKSVLYRKNKIVAQPLTIFFNEQLKKRYQP
ncbi:MAG: hypothetical protein RIS29_2381 [Bacteroidota bacterium]|jgi:hypothetical protein